MKKVYKNKLKIKNQKEKEKAEGYIEDLLQISKQEYIIDSIDKEADVDCMETKLR